MRIASSHDSYFKDPDKFLRYCLGIVFGNVRLVQLILEIPQNEPVFDIASYASKIANESISSLQNFFDNPLLANVRSGIDDVAMLSHKNGEGCN